MRRPTAVLINIINNEKVIEKKAKLHKEKQVSNDNPNSAKPIIQNQGVERILYVERNL